MRKGRSSRRSRVSRPIPKGPLSEGASAEAGPASTPRVVLSVAPSVVSEVTAESRASSASRASLPSAPPPSEPPPEDEDDDADDEVTPEAPPAVEAKAAPPEPEPEPVAEPDLPLAPDLAAAPEPAPLATTEPMPPVSEALGPETRPSATLPPPANPDAVKEEPVTLAAPAPKSEGKNKKKKSPPASLTPPPVEAPGGDDDDLVESAEHVAIQEKFFSDGDLTRHLPVDDELDAIRPSKAMRMAEPEVVQRRERYSRYVKLAVAVAAVVCMAAIGRTLTSGGEPSKEKIVPAAETPKAVEAPKAVELPKEAPKAEVAPAPTTEPAAPSASASASAAPVEPEVAPSASAAPAERPTGDAKTEKKNAQTALEHRNTAEAIVAGEKSVAIDPTDGEAWLILGAAYQEKGDMAAARRAFASCTKEGKTGPVAECGKMLR